MKVLVRLDVSRAIGTGHWRRMSNLLAGLAPAKTAFLVRTDDPGNGLFAGSDVRFIESADDLEELSATCSNEHTNLVLLDLLHYPAGYLARLKARLTDAKLVVFHEYPHPAGTSDLSVNYNTFDGFESAGGPTFLAGPTYCILNPDLLRTNRATTTTGVLVSFGGSDPSGLTADFLQKVAPLLPAIPFVVHTGPFSRDCLHRLAPIGPNVRPPGAGESIFDLLASCRMAVTAGGNVMYEAIYMGVLPLVAAHNLHQAEFASNAARLGACQYFGAHPEVNWSALAECLLANYEAPRKPRGPLVDGKGAERLAERITRLCA